MKKDKTAIVTGGSGGIGKEICQRLADDGFNVVVHFHSNQDSAKEVADSIKGADGTAITVSADVSSESDVSKLFQEAVSHFGDIDVVVANAGAGGSGPISDCSLEDFEKLISVNLRGAFLIMRESARRLRGSGRIIFISSQLAERPRQGTGVYSATKAAIDAMLVSMSHELGPRGITVNSVRPGATVPGMFESANEERQEHFRQLSAFHRLGTPQDIAGVVAFLASEDSAWVTGQHIRADGGMSN